MTTLKEIAKLAGVSSATVSKIINGKDQNISAATRKRVQDIVNREGYIPNGIAKSLRVKNTKTIGLIMPDVMNLFFSELARKIEDAAEQRGYSVILCNSDNNDEKEENYINILQEKKVDGLIITASETSLSKAIEKCNIPIVLVDRNIDSEKKVGRITVDNEKGGFMATKYLIEKGCRNIGFISGDSRSKPTVERKRGYELALKENGIELNNNIIFYKTFQIDSGYEGVLSILEKHKIDAVFCGNDLIAIGAIKALKENNIKVPEDIKIIGFDDILFSRYIDPPLTTIRQPIDELGKNSIDILLNLIHKSDQDTTKILDPILIERESV